MKIPRKAPKLAELTISKLSDDKYLEILRKYVSSDELSKFSNTDKYYHWDKILHIQPPDELTHEIWWYLIKIKRKSNSKPITLIDKEGHEFSYINNDYINEQLHRIDLAIGGMIGSFEEAAVNPANKEQYLIRSLIEESITSSQLEGASTTRMVAKKMIRSGKKPSNNSERMIFNNYKTMQAIRKLKDEKLTEQLIFKIHKMITQGTLETPLQEGRFRNADELIEVGDQVDGTVYHIPPPSAELENRIQVMCDFANNEQKGYFQHPVIKAIILHFWLAYDHPFVDGNGRTARALFYWYMLKRGYWLCEYISISEIILNAQSKYIRAFLYTETDENDLTYFIIYHLSVIDKAIKSLNNYINRKQSEIKNIEAELKNIRLFNHRQRALISHALRHPYGYEYTVKSHMISHDIVYETARSDLNQLVDKGILESKKIKNSWIYNPALDIRDRLNNIE